MAENKKSFIAYCDWLETFDALPDDKAGQLVKHLFRYVNDLNPETDDILIKAVFVNIKQTLKRDLKKYEQKQTQFSEAGIESAKSRQLIKGTQLYVLRFYGNNEEFIKIGITDLSINRRYSSNEEGGFKYGYKFEIEYQFFESKNVKVVELENKILQKFKNKKYIPLIDFPRKNECFNLDSLNNIINYINTFNDV